MTPVPADPSDPTRDALVAQLAALQDRIATSAAIEQAKGALMVTYGLTPDSAFAFLRLHSQARNVKLRAIAAQLTSVLSGAPADCRTIARFEELIHTVTGGLRASRHPTDGARAPDLAAGPVAGWSQAHSGRQTPAVPPPGVTIAGNIPGLPLVYVNDAFTHLTGYPIGDVLGRNCRFLQGAGTDPRHVHTLSRALRTGRDVSLVMRNYRIDGSMFLNEVSICPIRDTTAQITHFIGTQIDVTHRATPG